MQSRLQTKGKFLHRVIALLSDILEVSVSNLRLEIICSGGGFSWLYSIAAFMYSNRTFSYTIITTAFLYIPYNHLLF